MEGKEKSGKGVVSAGEGPFAAANGPRLRCLRLAQDDLSSPYQLFFYTHHHAAFLYLITVLSQDQQLINRRQPILFRDLPVGQDIPARSVTLLESYGEREALRGVASPTYRRLRRALYFIALPYAPHPDVANAVPTCWATVPRLVSWLGQSLQSANVPSSSIGEICYSFSRSVCTSTLWICSWVLLPCSKHVMNVISAFFRSFSILLRALGTKHSLFQAYSVYWF